MLRCAVQSAPQMAHLLLLMGAVAVLLVGFGSIAFGDVVHKLADLGSALRGERASPLAFQVLKSRTVFPLDATAAGLHG